MDINPPPRRPPNTPALRGAILRRSVGSGSDALILTGSKGAQLRRSNFRRAVGGWPAAIRKAGLPADVRFHDLRHTGSHLAASSGATTRELMHRMGHGSFRVALIYQHATREIAERLDQLVTEQRNADDDGADEHPVAGNLMARQWHDEPSRGTALILRDHGQVP